MSNLAKLKKKAAEFEQKRQFERALGAYEEVLLAQEGSEDADVSLYNRVGDLQLRLGRHAEALHNYERAVDLYAERGFLNNSIALCNKILRQSPGTAHIHYKLGRVNALKGFRSDARQHFLTYAELMQKGGRLDEAFTALKEFAELSDGQEDLRLLLADQFARHDRPVEALEQLQAVLDRFEADRRHAEAQMVRERMRALDPGHSALRESRSDEAFDGVQPPRSTPAPSTSRSAERAMPELVLIDPSESGSRSSGASRGLAAPGASTEAAPADVADAPAPSPVRASGAVSMPDQLIRGADAALTADQDDAEAFSAKPFGVTDLGIVPTAHAPSLLTDAGGAADLEVMHGSGVTGGADAAAERLAADETLVIEPTAAAGAELASDGGTAGDFVLMPAVDGVAEAARADTVFGDDELLIQEPPVAADAESQRNGRASVAEGLDTAAFGAALDAGWAEAAPDDADDAAAQPQAELDIVMPEQPAESGDASDNPIADFDSWLASPSSLAAARAEPANEAAPPAVEIVEPEEAVELVADEPVTEAEEPATLELVAPEPPIEAEASAADRPRAWAPVVPPVVPTADAPRSVMPAPVAVRPQPTTPVATRPVEPPADAPADAGAFFNLGDWLREDEQPRSTRMVVEERAPSGDEEADFAAMLRKFKQGVAENVEDTDYDSHYDLGVAYKEMGLTEEAIAEFQRALRGTERRARTYEALGQCFLDLGQPNVASSLLQRATQEPGMDDQQLVGVLYLLGRAAEMSNHGSDAVRYYERVLAVDITFSDVAERIGSLEQVTR